MSVDLGNLNISLDQFNAVSSGKYNIGQLKVGADGASVYRTNNHKTLTFLNTTRISPEESFARDKNAAMRSFILKNLSYGARGVSSETVDLLAKRMTSYVDICAIDDKKERDAKLGEFFKKSNWLMPKEQKDYDDFKEKNGEAMADSVLEGKTLDERRLFNLFRNVLSIAFFRETSKIGLDFFRSKGTPVMFQFSDYSGKSYVGRENDLFKTEAWREGENSQGFREKGGSAITSSEMRHAVRMKGDSTVHFVGGL